MRFDDGTTSLQILSEIVGPTGHILVTPWWSIEANEMWIDRLAEVKRLSRQGQGADFIFLSNTSKELEILLAGGHKTMLLNQNTFVNERVFKIIDSKKNFAAVYNAKMAPFKRHELAQLVENLALIYSPFGEINDYLPRVKTMLPHAVFLNGDPMTASYQMLTPLQVAENLNRSRVGLCLSSAEGANYASMEYLLCGLSVVSTQNIGGRDHFLTLAIAGL
jgi:hypothetical protein